MDIHLGHIEDKIECFEATSMKALESKINEQVENNKVLLLEVFHVQHHVYIHPLHSQPVYTAIVHFKQKQQ